MRSGGLNGTVLYGYAVLTSLEFAPYAPISQGRHWATAMGNPEDWRRMDDYYWAGPPGWTSYGTAEGTQDR